MDSDTFYELGKTAVELANYRQERPKIEARAGAYGLLVGEISDPTPAYQGVGLVDLVTMVRDALYRLTGTEVVSDSTQQVAFRVEEITRKENPASAIVQMGTQVEGQFLPDQLMFIQNRIRESPEDDELKYHMYVIIGVVVFALGMLSVLHILRHHRDRSKAKTPAIRHEIGAKASSFHVQ